MNPKKCVFAVSSEKLLGFIISKQGIEIDPNKTKAISRNTISKKYHGASRIDWSISVH